MQILTIQIAIPSGSEPVAKTLLNSACEIFGLSTGMATDDDDKRAIASSIIAAMRKASLELDPKPEPKPDAANSAAATAMIGAASLASA